LVVSLSPLNGVILCALFGAAAPSRSGHDGDGDTAQNVPSLQCTARLSDGDGTENGHDAREFISRKVDHRPASV